MQVSVPHCSFFLNLWPQLGVQDLFLQSLLIKSFDWTEKNYKNWKLQKDWKLQETFVLPPKAKNAAFAAVADSTCLWAMKWSWVSEMVLLSVIIEQSVMSAKTSLLISFCKMFFSSSAVSSSSSVPLTILKEVFFFNSRSITKTV